MKRWRFVCCLMMLCLVLPACGQHDRGAGGDGAGDVVSSREEIESATVQVTAEGSFKDPETGQQVSGGWGGSGFIIDPSGIAVTNNHVVTGAALLQVYVAGEEDPLNAKVLGVSECADLAVID